MGWNRGSCVCRVFIVLGALLLVGCAGELEGPAPEFSGEPGASSEEDRLMQPAFVCNEQIEDRAVEIRGENFTPVVKKALEDPTVDPPEVRLERSAELDVRDSGEATDVTFGADEFETERLRWLEQERLQIVLDESLGLEPGLYDLTLTNPTGTSDSREEAFAVLPRPVVESVEPDIACAGSGEQQVTVQGGPFLRNPDGEVAPVDIGGQTYEGDQLEAGECTSYEEGPLSGWSTCSQVTATVSIDAYEPGLKSVGVQSTADADCRSLPEEDDVQFRVLRRPVVEEVSPSPVCTQQNTYTATVTGENFVFDTAEETTPTVTVGGETVDVSAPTDPSSAEACTPVDIDGVFSCSELEVELAPEGFLHEDGTITESEVSVQNPPERAECSAEETDTIQNAPPPQVDSGEILATCGDGPDNMVLEGDFHMSMGDRGPSVEITTPGGESSTYEGEQVELSGTCTELDDPTEPTSSCQTTMVTMTEQNDPPEGEYQVTYTNPESVQCSRDATLQVQRTIPDQPSIQGIDEGAVCALGDSLTINGENFKEGAVVTLGQTEADSVTVSDDGTTIDATWMGEIEAGENPTLTVRNPDECTASQEIADSLDIVDGPLAVFLDPPVHFNRIAFRGTLYASGGTDRTISRVEIRDSDGNVRELGFNNSTENDGEVSPLLPAEDPNNQGNPLPAGEYDVRLTEEVSGTECGAWVDDLVSVTDDENLAVEDIEPKFGGTGTSTSVRITASENVSGNQTQFQPTPRVYISPELGTAGSEAEELSGVTFNSATELTGIVPGVGQAGEYNIVVVNPDETVGVLGPQQGGDGFTVTADPPPTISNVTPGTWESPGTVDATVTGQNFRVSSGQSSPTPINITCDSGPAPGITLQSATDTSIDLQLDTDNMDQSDACVLEVTNPDGTKASYSPLATVQPSSNFVSFEDSSTTWNQSRRWPAMSSGTPSAQQRFLYVLGGDDGSTNGIWPGGEFAQIDQFGNVQSWDPLPYNLPGSGRTLARAHRVGDFIYLVGGNDGSSATADIHRANVLDPQHVPDIDGLDFEFDDPSGDGLSSGVYYYRVSAVHDSNSAYNPGGETLTSDVQPVYVPDLSGRFSVQVQISWEASNLSNIDEFRVYRSESPGATVGDEKLLATFNAGTTSFTDDGDGMFSGDEPLPVGALGEWHSAGSLQTARQRHAVKGLVATSDDSQAHIYAVGGEDDTGTALDSIERIDISDADQPRSQTVSSITELSSTMSSARVEPEALVATPDNANNLSSGNAYLYAIGGTATGGQGGGNGSDTVDAWPIGSGGSLGSIRNEATPGKARAGHVGTVANNFVLLFGGQNASASDAADNSNRLQSGGDITDWNSLGDVSMTPRYQFGRTSLTGFFYIGGGINGQGSVSNSIEYSVVGTTAR